MTAAQIGICIEGEGSSVVEGNTISNAHDTGIFCYLIPSIQVRHNKITNVSKYGIKCQWYSPVLKGNRIANSLQGIHCFNSFPILRSNTVTKNKEFGVYVDSGSWADMGREDDHGNNSIFSNGKFDVYSECPDTVQAVGNWWGNPIPNPNQFHGKINYAESLSAEPKSITPMK